MNESGIISLLSVRHKDDVFIPKCRTSGIGYHELDAWAMEKGWTRPRIIGYEVKVTRADFMADKKWQNYVPFCNELYFVVPYKMVNPDEVPGRCGLIWVSRQAARLYTKKKSDYWLAQTDQLVNLFKHVIFSRTNGKKNDLEDYWRRWLEHKSSLKNMGHLISKQLHDQFRDEVNKFEERLFALRKENDALRRELCSYRDTIESLRKQGINITDDRSKVRESVCKLVRENADGVREKIAA